MTGKKALRIPDYLRHILHAVAQIETYAEGVEFDALLKSQLLQDAIIRNVEIVGEAANNILKLDSGFETKHPGLELKAAYGMRNSLSHGYFLVDPVLVWGTIKNDLPVLKKRVEDVLEKYTAP